MCNKFVNTGSLDFGDCINSLALNQSSTRLLIGGRKLLKVVNLEDESFGEQINLRLRDTANLSYSAIDVAWGSDNLVASAAANGVVILWDLNKPGRNKKEYSFIAHDRTCNRLSFHATNPHLLLSGAQDGKMVLMDVREKAICQVYNKDAATTMSIRDVQFSTLQPNAIAAGYDSGIVQTWDMRNTAHWEKQFTAHNGPVFTIDWHPEERNWLATGGRDKMIKVWVVGDSARYNVPAHSLQMIASTARVKWRPNYKYQLASSAQLMDFGINIWDIRRPFVAFAAFGVHQDIATDIEWLNNEGHYLVSCGKDGRVVCHSYELSKHPVDNVCPVTVQICPSGDVVHAYNAKMSLNTDNDVKSFELVGRPNQQLYYQLSAVSSRLSSVVESHPGATSRLAMYSHHADLTSSDSHRVSTNRQQQQAIGQLSMNWFIEMARNYRLSGDPVSSLCEHNAGVASRLKFDDVAQTWKMLAIMVTSTSAAASMSTSFGSTPARSSIIPLVQPAAAVTNPMQLALRPSSSAVAGGAISVAIERGHTEISATFDKPKLECHAEDNFFIETPGPSDNESGECNETDGTSSYTTSGFHPTYQSRIPLPPTAALSVSRTTTVLRSMSPTEMMFGDMDFLADNLGINFESENGANLDNSDEWQSDLLPSEPFYDAGVGNDDHDSDTEDDESATSRSDTEQFGDDDVNQQSSPVFSSVPIGFTASSIRTDFDSPPPRKQRIKRMLEESPVKQEILNATPFSSSVPALDFTNVIVDMIRQYASQNDVQMAVCVLLCLGEKYVRLIDAALVEQWFSAYIELLHQFELYSIAADVIKQSTAVREINMMSCISTRIITSCTGCGRALNKTGWVCERCSGYVHVCYICHLPVRGLYVWCQGCSHGGHIEHVQSWFSDHTSCPTGCGHECEMT